MRDILTSEEAISEDMPYPPYASRQRIEGYENNLERFKGSYNEGKSIRMKNLNGGIDVFPLSTQNYFRLMTLKLQGLLLNEKPTITVKDTVKGDLLNELIKKCDFWKCFLAAYRNFSSLGTGVIYLSFDGETPRVNAVNPKHLYKIVSSQNIEDVVCYILTQPIYKVDYKLGKTEVEKMRVLYHYKGYYIEKVFGYRDGNIKKLESEKRIETGLSDFAVFCFENSAPTDEVYGQSDYDAIADTVLKYERLLTIVDAVLIKNVNPILQVPMGVFTENEQTGKLEAPANGDVVEVEPNSKDLKYISYDMQVADTMKYLESLLNELGIQSEMSKTFLTGEFTSNLSGEAIKSLLKAPLDKIGRAIDEMDEGVKRLFSQMLRLVGYECEVSEIEIEWRDGIDGTLDDEVKPIGLNPNQPVVEQPVTEEVEEVE